MIVIKVTVEIQDAIDANKRDTSEKNRKLFPVEIPKSWKTSLERCKWVISYEGEALRQMSLSSK